MMQKTIQSNRRAFVPLHLLFFYSSSVIKDHFPHLILNEGKYVVLPFLDPSII